MSDVTLPHTIATGQQRSAAKIQANDEALRDFVNGDGWIDLSKIGSDVAAALSLSQSGSVRRGKSITTTEQSRTNTAYGPLSGTSGTDATDEVRDVVLPTDGVLAIAFHGLWKESVTTAARAALFLNDNQLRVGIPPSGTAVSAARNNASSTAGIYTQLMSGNLGLVGSTAAVSDVGVVTTGQIVGGPGGDVEIVGGTTAIPGGPVYVFAAAGTYDVSVRFKSSSGSVTAKERKLWVWTLAF